MHWFTSMVPLTLLYYSCVVSQQWESPSNTQARPVAPYFLISKTTKRWRRYALLKACFIAVERSAAWTSPLISFESSLKMTCIQTELLLVGHNESWVTHTYMYMYKVQSILLVCTWCTGQGQVPGVDPGIQGLSEEGSKLNSVCKVRMQIFRTTPTDAKKNSVDSQ